MNFLRLLKTGSRLGLVLGIIVLMLGATCTLSYLRLAHIRETTATLVDEDWRKAEAATRVDTLTRANARRTMELFVATQPEHIERVNQAIARNKQQITESIQTLESLVRSTEGKSLLAAVVSGRVGYVASLTKVAELIKGGQKDDATRELLETTLPAIDGLQEKVAALSKFQTQLADTHGDAIEQDIGAAQLTLQVFAIAAVLAAVALGWLVTRSIVQPMHQALQVARSVAQGDLTHRVHASEQDEAGHLLNALNAMSESLERTVGAVRQGSDQIATASTQIASGNADLSQRTEEQAANLQQTAASMEQLTSTVQQNAASADAASGLANEARDVAAHGGQVMASVVSTMNDISDSSRRIADIIGVIDGIAFQTNILALNAAVEAARAGEQGRGFAVVAGEVRSLAQRSALAAKEIKTLIEQSVTKVDDGANLVREAGTTMDRIVNQVERVTCLVGEISTASHEQSRGISQVGQAVSQLDQVTQQNAALVEESAAAAESMQHQAQQLAQAISVFKLAGA